MSDARRLADLRRAQLRAREIKRGVGAMLEGRSGLPAPMGRRQGGTSQAGVTVQLPAASPAHDGRWIEIEIPAQTWTGPLQLGSVVTELGWPDPEVFPAGQSYYDVHLDLPVATPADLTWSFDVDGATRRSGTMWAVNKMQGVIPVGTVGKNDPWEFVGDGLELAAGGRLIMQLVDRQKAQAAPDAPPGMIEDPWTGTASFGIAFSVSVPATAQAGDLSVVVFRMDSTQGNIWSNLAVPSGWTVLHDSVTGESAGQVLAYGTLTEQNITDGSVSGFGADISGSGTRRWVYSACVFAGGTPHLVDVVEYVASPAPQTVSAAGASGTLVAVTTSNWFPTEENDIGVDGWPTGRISGAGGSVNRWARSQYAQAPQSDRTWTSEGGTTCLMYRVDG